MTADLDIFGPTIIAFQVEDAIENTLKLWLPTYLRWLERVMGKEPGALPEIESITCTSDWDHFPEEHLPAILIMGSEAHSPKMDGSKEYRATFPVDVGIFVSALDRRDTERLAKMYGAVVRALILQKGSLGNFAIGTCWEGERYGVHITDTSQRTLGAAEVKFSVEVRQVVRRLAGPLVPILTEPAKWPEVTHKTPVVIKPEPIK